MLRKQKKYENAIIINDSAHIDRIIKKPREGKVYIYHQGFVARDRGTDYTGLHGFLRKVLYYAERNQINLYQNKICRDEYTYILVR